jgi:hypothetical protein
MEHYAAVKQGVRRRGFAPFPYKAVFQLKMIIGIGLFEIQVAELIVEIAVLVVAHLYHAVFYAERVAVVLAYGVVVDLHEPVVDIFAVEKRFPYAFLLGFGFNSQCDYCHQAAQEFSGHKCGVASR